MKRHDGAIDVLLKSSEPSVRLKVRVHVLGEDAQSSAIRKLRDEVRASPRVKRLLRLRDRDGRITGVRGVYDKWKGAHWVLAALADLGYPEGDASLHPMRDQVLDYWLAERFFRDFDADGKAAVQRMVGVPRIRGRPRRCASQHGNALLSVLRLGIADERAGKLVERLLHWQWPDGGWNCDRDPAADTSSFMETLLPMRGLAAHARHTGDNKAARASHRAADVFLSRKLFKRRSDGKVIRADFVKLFYPYYWHYNVLAGLIAMTEMGRIDDPRCGDALDLLESKQLPGGGWTANSKYYEVSDEPRNATEAVDWGGAGARRMNEWVTADALAVLKAAGRLAV